MTLQEFLDKDLSQYASYRVVQRIPQVIDGTGLTSRKVIYSFLKKKISKKIKTLDVYSLTKKVTKYAHGDTSIYSTMNNLVAEFKNNISIFTEDGSFGSRTETSAAAPRYTETRLKDVAYLIYRPVDYDLMPLQEFEGEKIEPVTLLPIIPMGVINGHQGIALGYSSRILPRNPLKVIDQLLSILKKEKSTISILPPSFPQFKGKVEKDPKDIKRWYINGNVYVSKSSKFKYIIDEVPFGYDRAKCLTIFNEMKKEKLIKRYTENCRENSFYFEIFVDGETADKLSKMSREKLLDYFSMRITAKENYTFLDENYKIQVFNTYSEYIAKYIKDRGQKYVIRREKIIKELEDKLVVLTGKKVFIEKVVGGEIEIYKRSKKDIIKQISNFKDINKIDDSYEYLLNMKIYNLTAEKIKELEKQYKDTKRLLKETRQTTPAEMWVSELEELREHLVKK